MNIIDISKIDPDDYNIDFIKNGVTDNGRSNQHHIRFNYPYAAVEESLCNAAYHKGYDVREPIEVRVLPDRIEIVSHPGADRSITEEGLKNYRVFNRRYRNRRIGEFLKEMHLTEGRNTGFRKILNALEHNGSPKPLFETDPERLSFYTTLFIHPEFLRQHEEINEGIKVEISENTVKEGINEEINEEINQSLGQNLSDRELLVLSLIKSEPSISIAQMVNRLKFSKTSIERALNHLKSKKIITREGSRKKGLWIILP